MSNMNGHNNNKDFGQLYKSDNSLIVPDSAFVDKLITELETEQSKSDKRKFRPKWFTALPAAAVLCVIIGVVIYVATMGGTVVSPIQADWELESYNSIRSGDGALRDYAFEFNGVLVYRNDEFDFDSFADFDSSEELENALYDVELEDDVDDFAEEREVGGGAIEIQPWISEYSYNTGYSPQYDNYANGGYGETPQTEYDSQMFISPEMTPPTLQEVLEGKVYDFVECLKNIIEKNITT